MCKPCAQSERGCDCQVRKQGCVHLAQAITKINTMRKIIPYNPILKKRAQDLRNNSTLSEVRLWTFLKGTQMCGYDFHRQKPLGNFIVDFFCNELMLGIELDDYTHTLHETIEKDKIKEGRLKALGITVMRFDDHEVMFDINNVLRAIEGWIKEFKTKNK